MAHGGAPTELGTLSVTTLLRRFAIPAIIAMTASSLYNMIDSAFLGHIPGTGGLAIAGVTICFPLMNISTALGTLVGVGASTMISVLLGQKNYQSANRVLANELTLNVIVGAVFTLFCLLFMDPVLRMFGASETVLPYARDYMLVIALGNIVTHLYFGLNSVIRAEGNPTLAMKLTLFTVSSNAVLDYLFIYPLGMGIQGAALATVLCQLMALCYVMKYFFNQEKLLHFPKSRPLQLDWRIAKDSLAVGMGPFLMNLASCIVVILINKQLGKYGSDQAIAAYGIVNRISFLFIMVTMGFNQGMQPIAGYNYGARLYSRVRQVYLRAAMWATVVMCVGFCVAMFIPHLVAGIFTSNPALQNMAAHGLRIMNCAFPIIGFQMVTTNLFQCLGMVGKSIFLSLSRQLLFLLPCIYFLPELLGGSVDGVWYSFPIADAVAAVVTGILAIGLLRKLSALQDGDSPASLGSKIQ
ncbi:MAG: MATE family efflux transporter [Bacteroidota bacterium]|nr:MATE family efflux transporter [Bacteroidota bacterium]